MGCPEVLITDQGREFVNSLSSQLYEQTNTEHRITSAYHPQTNGLTERFKQTLSRCLSKVINDSHNDWDLKIDTVLMGYRASRQASTKQSPFYMLFQTEMRLPIDSEMLPTESTSEITESITDTTQDAIDLLLKSRERSFKDAHLNIQLAQKQQKETYDRKRKPPTFAEGSKVLLENTAQKQRKGGKLQVKWMGPYTVNKDIGKQFKY